MSTQQKRNSFEGTRRSSLISSVSKAQYTFPKASRFNQLKQGSSSFYKIPTTLSPRSTSFGFGNKSDLVNKFNTSPSPDKYQKKSQFQLNPKKGIGFGLGRNDCKNVSIFVNSKTPSPLDYSIQNKENSKTYSIACKLKLPELFPDRKTPGPGYYTYENIQKNGVAFNSKYKTNKSFKISEQSAIKSSAKKQMPVLGPLTYHTQMPATGKQILSKKRTQKSFYFDKKIRQTIQIRPNIPGPGAYSFHSSFGN